MSCRTLDRLQKVAQRKMQTFFDISDVRILLIDENKSLLVYYTQDHERVENSLGFGLAGESAVTGKLLTIPCGYSDNRFNALVDIESNLPLVCFPILAIKSNKIIGVI